jgi:hypothetical protein
MVTPAAIAASQYYKIGDFVTFAWNYTSLSVTPTAIDVLASCSLNDQLYTIALNQSVQPTGAVTWDTGEYQATATIPLLTETYTLVIYDAAQDITTVPQAGYLAVQDQFQFGMYVPQPYTPLNGELACIQERNVKFLTESRVQVRNVQCRNLGSRATSFWLVAWNEHHHFPFLHLVCKWLWRFLMMCINKRFALWLRNA